MAGAQSLQGKPAGTAQLGTFLGVFTPSILTILGVVLFLRTGWMVANVGLIAALAIVALAHLITISTALSVSAVATNMHVGAGGAYFMISRSLGLELGGAIGVPLFLAQTFSVTLYSFGFVESLELFWPDIPQRPVAAVTVLAVALVAGRSATLALRLQLPIMVAIAGALISLIVGASGSAQESIQPFDGIEDGLGFWAVFAVFFPAVTGIMAGVSLSGDLKDPKKSIPLGTLIAVSVGFLVYLLVPVVLALAASPEALGSNNLIWFDIAAVKWLIIPGLLGAILSSAAGSILGAPRTLEALIEDRVLPRPPEKVLGIRLTTGEAAHWLSTAVALAAVGLGGLNAVAPVLTMFFLTTYGMVNLVAGLEQLSGAPAYRPSIHVPWYVSLGGAVSCIWVMSLINLWAAIIALTVEVAVYVALRRRSLSASWGDLRYGALISLARVTLLKLKRLPVDPRNWRPHILIFVTGEPRKHLDLLRFAAWLNQNRGLLTLCKIMVGDLEALAHKSDEATRETDRFLDDEGVLAFAETEIVPSFESGVLAIAQANGIAGISSNTLMFGWSEQPDRMLSILRVVRQVESLGKSSVLCRIAPRRWSAKLKRIDVWWGGLQNNGDMLLLFAYLISVNSEWADAKINVKTVASNAMTHDQTDRGLRELIRRCRIKAQPKVIQRATGETVQSIIQAESRDADLVFLGLQSAAAGEEEAYYERLQGLVGDLPTVILVRAAGDFAGHLL